MAKTPSGNGLEVHEHCFTRGPRANGSAYKFSHSHEGGDAPHEHPNTGPACYTIDKDDWARATGMRGGGRKRYTVKPNGEQFALVPAAPGIIDIFIAGEPPTADAPQGPGIGLPVRIATAFRMKVRVHDLRSGRGNAA